jgi:hypothetical protein
MKRALAVLGTFAAIGFAIALGASPASAQSCIYTSTCAAPVGIYHDPGFTHNSADPGFTHDGINAHCRNKTFGC